MKILIDIGHGPQTFEKTGGKGIKGVVEEYDLNKLMSISLYSILKNIGIDVAYLQDISTPEDMPLKQRSNKVNKIKPDLLISMHHDYSKNTSSNGFTCYYWHSNLETLSLCNKIKTNLLKKGIKNSAIGNGVKACRPDVEWPNFHMLRETNCPAILLECDFFSNKAYIEKVNDVNYRKTFCIAIAEAITTQFEIKYKPAEKTWIEIIAEECIEKELWVKGIETAVKLAKDKSNFGDLEIFAYLPELIKKIYMRGM